jgi:hypothetical protein
VEGGPGGSPQACQESRQEEKEMTAKPSTGNPAPGYKKYPEHRIETKPAKERVRVTFNGEVIADTRDAIRMEEGNYPAVFYFPRKDVKMERLIRSSHLRAAVRRDERDQGAARLLRRQGRHQRGMN